MLAPLASKPNNVEHPSKRIVYINSKHRRDGSIDDFTISFNDLQVVKDSTNHKVYMSVIDVVLTNSFYNIRSINNKLKIGSTTITITEGNYNINQLVSAISSAVSAAGVSNFTFTYNSITSKLTIAHTNSGSLVIDFNITGSLADVLGFDKVSYTLAPSTNLIGPNICNIGTPQCLYLLSSVSNENLQSGSFIHLEQSNILCKIPILVPNFSNMYFHSSGNENYRQEVPVSIDTVSFQIVDENFNAVGLNKDFVFTLLFETKSVVDTIGLKTADSLKEIEKLQKLQFIARQ